MLLHGESNGKREVLVAKALLLSPRSTMGEGKGKKLARVRYMDCMPPFNKVKEALGCVCLQPATAGSAEQKYNKEKEKAIEMLLLSVNDLKWLQFRVL